GVTLLLASGAFGLRAWWLYRQKGISSTYWFLASIGMLFLAADERLSLHEKAGRFLADRGLSTPGSVNHLDDVIVIAYAVAGLVLTVVLIREVISQHWSVLAPYVLALGLTAASIAVDARAPIEGHAPVIE